MRRWQWSFGINPRDLSPGNARALKPEDWTRCTPYFRKQAHLTLLCSFVLADPSNWMNAYHNGESRSSPKAVGSNACLFLNSFIGSPRLTHYLFDSPQPGQTAKPTTTMIKQTNTQTKTTHHKQMKQNKTTNGKKTKNTKKSQCRSKRNKKLIKGNILPYSIYDP